MRCCATKYPIMLIHGTGFRDRKVFGYWGRIPKALEERGAVIAYGGQDSWGTIEDNARWLRRSLEAALVRLGAQKVNIIAHSKGGLEARYLVSSLGCDDKVASITTISTPHGGAKTMDCLMRAPLFLQATAMVANPWFRLLGDQNPRFYEACRQFTTGYMREFNRANTDVDGIYYQSYATVMKGPLSDLLMAAPYAVTRLVEGESDGLVTPASATWTNFRGVWSGAGRRGISHADSVDARRMRLAPEGAEDGISDITGAYIDLVAGLRSKGL